jgi:two-component system sensor kinase FixL
MRLIREHPWYAETNSAPLTLIAFSAIAVLAIIDWLVVPNVGIGFLYFIPVGIAAAFLSRSQIIFLAAVCTTFRESFSGLPGGAERIPRVTFEFLAYAFTGLLVREMVVYRRAMARHLKQLEREVTLRHQAEEQLEVLINSSPAGIITFSPDGKIVLSNQAAHQVFGVGSGGLSGQPVSMFLPLVEQLRGMQARTAMECRGRRANGEGFHAHVWLSTFNSNSGTTTAAIILDSSEEMRDREEAGLQQLLAGSRIMVGAVSHELRNFAGAIAVVHENLGKIEMLRNNHDFQALGKLVEGLRAVASSNIFVAGDSTEGVDIISILEDFRIVITPSAEDAHCDVSYDFPEKLPLVRGMRERLLQVFLNLAMNSFRAMQVKSERKLVISGVRSGDGAVLIRFEDSGPGVPNSDLLFKPFHAGVEPSGLGLYISRAILRSFAGDLRYERSREGARFVVELTPARAEEGSRSLEGPNG